MSHNYINDPLAAIYNKKWQLSTVSSLHNFHTSAVKLKQYESKVRQALSNTVPAYSTIKFTVLLEVHPLLKFSEDDSEGVTITVLASIENLESKVVYKSILLSWGVSTKLRNTVHLPYMLENGEKSIGKVVKKTLQIIFDCYFEDLKFTQDQLLQFGFNFVEKAISLSTDPFIFCYKSHANHNDEHRFSLEIGDVLIIWNGVKEKLSNIAEQILLAYEILQRQIFYSVMVDINTLYLSEIKFSKAQVKRNGVIKMKTPDLVKCVFKVINEISEFSS